MHDLVYAHRKCKSAELMVVDAILAAAEDLKLRESITDLKRYTYLDDSIVRELERSTSQNTGILRAQHILRRFRRRQLYRYCGEVEVPQERLKHWTNVQPLDIISCQSASNIQLTPEDIKVHNHKLDFSNSDQNPIDHVGFYSSDSQHHATRLQEGSSLLQPHTFLERKVRVYLCREYQSKQEERQLVQAVQAAFSNWAHREFGSSAHMDLPVKGTSSHAAPSCALKRRRLNSAEDSAISASPARSVISSQFNSPSIPSKLPHLD
jgi:HD superfamily phosphohydrolase